MRDPKVNIFVRFVRYEPQTAGGDNARKGRGSICVSESKFKVDLRLLLNPKCETIGLVSSYSLIKLLGAESTFIDVFSTLWHTEIPLSFKPGFA